MNATAKTDYLLLFRGNIWDRGLSPEQLQKVVSDWMAWFERLKAEGKCTGGHPLEDRGKVVSGKQRTVLSVAEDLAEVMGQEGLAPHIVGKYRAGDIRHCFADISHARQVLGYAPRMPFAEGLAATVAWYRERRDWWEPLKSR